MTKISEFTTQIADGLNATDRFEVARPGQAVEFYATPENIKEYVITPNLAALDANDSPHNTTPGYFDGYQVILGEALYTANFAVPTTPPPYSQP
jgi:hypothetical protein